MITRPPLSVATSLGTRNDGADIDWRFLHASPPEETRWTITNPPTPLAFFQLTELIDPADFTVPSLYVSANAPALPDIGADEFVYRIAFPLDTAGHSLVDEASGVAYLTNNATGPLIAVVDDEDRTHFRIYQLNADATAVVQSFPVSVRNTTNYTDAGEQEIHDMEGLTFDRANNRLFVMTSLTKRDRYRDVDSSPPVLDPVLDPPSNDYDRRRTVLVRMRLNSALTTVTNWAFYESEHVPVPHNAGYDATNGLVAFIRQRLTNNPALGATNLGNRVLIAWNRVNKFGTPVNGVAYPAGSPLPYFDGGPTNAAGVSILFADPGTNAGTFTKTGLTLGSTNFYRIWAVDANLNYYPGPTVGVTNDGLPRVCINEFDAAGNNETVELYNPGTVGVDIGGWGISDGDNNYIIPAGTTIPPRGVWMVNSSAWTNRWQFNDNGQENIFVIWSDQSRILDEWNMKAPEGNTTQGRVWDGGPRGFRSIDEDFDSCLYRTLSPPSPYPPTLGALNHPQRRKYFDAVPSVDGAKVYLAWQDIGRLPATRRYSPKQHDNHAINLEDLAYRSSSEMVLSLRAPLTNRTTGHAYYFVVTNVTQFLATRPWPAGTDLQGIAGPFQMDLEGLGIRGIKWCPVGLTNAQGSNVQRYLVLAGTADGGPVQREQFRQKFSLYAWDGTRTNNVARPQKLIDDLWPYTIRPEGVDLLYVNGEWRVLFVEDRFLANGYATRNAVHWPLNILGTVE